MIWKSLSFTLKSCEQSPCTGADFFVVLETNTERMHANFVFSFCLPCHNDDFSPTLYGSVKSHYFPFSPLLFCLLFRTRWVHRNDQPMKFAIEERSFDFSCLQAVGKALTGSTSKWKPRLRERGRPAVLVGNIIFFLFFLLLSLLSLFLRTFKLALEVNASRGDFWRRRMNCFMALQQSPGLLRRSLSALEPVLCGIRWYSGENGTLNGFCRVIAMLFFFWGSERSTVAFSSHFPYFIYLVMPTFLVLLRVPASLLLFIIPHPARDSGPSCLFCVYARHSWLLRYSIEPWICI